MFCVVYDGERYQTNYNGLKVINIGQRQKGRISPKEVINIKCKKKYIIIDVCSKI